MKNKILLLTIAFSLLMSVFFAAFLHNVTGLPTAPVALVLIALSCVPVKNAQGAMLDALNITDLVNKLGAYYRQNRNILISETLLGMQLDDRFEVWDDVKDEVAMPNLSITDLIKPADHYNFTPTSNALKFGARIGKVRPWKVDLQIVPDTLVKTWLGSYQPQGSNPFSLPFEGFIFQYIIAKIHENLRLQALFKGVYNAAGVTPPDVMDGVNTLLAAEILALNIVPVVTGVITQANVGTALLAVYDSLGEAYKFQPTIMPVSPQIFDWYTRKFMPILNPALIATDVATGLTRGLMNSMPLSGTNCTLLREPGLSGSQRVYCTPKSNIVYLTDTLGDENNFEIQKFERTIKIMIDAKSGVQFKQIHSRALAVNDQA